jgi:hypothetical protein
LLDDSKMLGRLARCVGGLCILGRTSVDEVENQHVKADGMRGDIVVCRGGQ